MPLADRDLPESETVAWGKETEPAWEGTFAEYLSMVAAEPRLARSAHARLYDLVVEAGVEPTSQGRRYAFFAGELFGVEPALERLVEGYLAPAARGLEVRRRILLLVGPVASGKSTLVNLLKRGLEQYSRTDRGALYALRDCPMHEDPLHLIPPSLRPDFFRRFGIRIEGELCPYCRVTLREVYAGRVEDVPVRRIFLSEQERVGIGTFVPSDPKSQDLAELTGSLDWSRITRYGAESDPRAYCFDGELNVANRGLMEFQELLKVDQRFLYLLLSLAQEGNFKAGRFALISCDTVVVGHTNEADFRRFCADPRNQALCSRLFVVPWPYSLRVEAETQIYRRLLEPAGGRVHLAPHSLRAAASFAVLSRLQEPRRPGLDLPAKMRLYDGEEVAGYDRREAEELRAEAEGEGMRGVDPRLVYERLAGAVVAAEGGCLTPRAVLDCLRRGVQQDLRLGPPERERLLALLDLAQQDYRRKALADLRRAVAAGWKAEARRLFQRYLEKARRLVARPEDSPEEETAEAGVELLETCLGLDPTARRIFREELVELWARLAHSGREFDYRQDPQLREAVEEALVWQVLDEGAGSDDAGSEAGDAPQSGALPAGIEKLRQYLIEEVGYCPHCARELVEDARKWSADPERGERRKADGGGLAGPDF
ncbi:MAG: protein prkA [Moorellales bacterium]